MIALRPRLAALALLPLLGCPSKTTTALGITRFDLGDRSAGM